MRIFKTVMGILVEHEDHLYASEQKDWDAYINRDDLYAAVLAEINGLNPAWTEEWVAFPPPLAPIGAQEIWAAGVTYKRSKAARMEESKESGAATFYDKVYEAERPELFFKALAQRVMGTGGPLRIRADSTWNVPEPELTLFVTSSGKIVGYTIGNDMSSRSIEGENPLYLPQAKVYERCAGLGPCILVAQSPLPPSTEIYMRIMREEKIAFEGMVPISAMKRDHAELVAYLYRECAFPNGCFLMTGTGIVPPGDFTLHPGDIVIIRITGIGELTNVIELPA